MGIARGLVVCTLGSLLACGGSQAASSPRATAPAPAGGSRGESGLVAVEGFQVAPGEDMRVWSDAIAPGEAIPVTGEDPMWGDADAPVTIVAFEDLQCTYCADAAKTVEDLMAHYGPHQV